MFTRKGIVDTKLTLPGALLRGTLAGMFMTFLLVTHAEGQVSLAETIRLATTNSPRVKAAELDFQKAQAGSAMARDYYIPSVVVGGGAGYYYGIMLTVPTIFTVNAQSLLFSFQQRDYMRAAHADVQAARLALEEVKQQVEEDAAITYLSLDAAQETSQALDEQYSDALKLAGIMQDRFHAKLESELEVIKYHRGALQIKLAKMQADDNAEDLRNHLSELTGLAADELKIAVETIPTISEARVSRVASGLQDTPGIQAAGLNNTAKSWRAKGDAAYTWRPQVTFAGGYGRVSPIQNVSEFYNLNGIYNTYSVGVQVQVPLVDFVRRSAAKQTRLDTERSLMDLQSLRSDELAGHRKLERSLPELTTKAELADVEYQIAQNELGSVETQSHHAMGGTPITPKDVENARIEERQKYVEMLDAKLQARKAQITELRLTGELESWVTSLKDAPAADYMAAH